MRVCRDVRYVMLSLGRKGSRCSLSPVSVITGLNIPGSSQPGSVFPDALVSEIRNTSFTKIKYICKPASGTPGKKCNKCYIEWGISPFFTDFSNTSRIGYGKRVLRLFQVHIHTCLEQLQIKKSSAKFCTYLLSPSPNPQIPNPGDCRGARLRT